MSGKIYAGRVKNYKRKDGVEVSTGKRYDVTQDFLNCIVQKFKPGNMYLVLDQFDEPYFTIDIKMCEEAEV
jgi:hypothetical protein